MKFISTIFLLAAATVPVSGEDSLRKLKEKGNNGFGTGAVPPKCQRAKVQANGDLDVTVKVKEDKDGTVTGDFTVQLAPGPIKVSIDCLQIVKVDDGIAAIMTGPITECDFCVVDNSATVKMLIKDDGTNLLDFYGTMQQEECTSEEVQIAGDFEKEAAEHTTGVFKIRCSEFAA